jgi:hypothetical protein
MLPFDDLDDEQRCVVPTYCIYYPLIPSRISIANDHPNDLDSGPSSPSYVAPSYLRHRRQSKSTSRHRSHTTTEGSTSHLLARLIARDDEVREINALLVVTSERLETESNRANTSERRALEYFSRLRQATEGRDRAEQDAARLREELKLYKLQLDNAQKEIFRAQDIINQVSAQKSEAEADAARARTKARKLIEEKMVMIAHEEGRHRGYKEGLSYGRRLGFDEGRSRPIRYSASSARRIPQRGVLPDGEGEEEEEEEEESVHSERSNVLLRPRVPPQQQQYVTTYTCAIVLIFYCQRALRVCTACASSNIGYPYPTSLFVARASKKNQDTLATNSSRRYRLSHTHAPSAQFSVWPLNQHTPRWLDPASGPTNILHSDPTTIRLLSARTS